MKRWRLIIIASIVVGILITMGIVFLNNINKEFDSNINDVCFDSICFNVEIADSFAERKSGLMNVSYLERNSGMLFVFDSLDKYGFWMKDTLIPLDIIWIDSDLEIVYIYENALPCVSADDCVSMVPDRDAFYVLEVNTGVVDEIGLRVGDRMRFVKG